MANYNEATLDHPKFQQNTPAGRSWRKRYTKENGGEWVNDGTWNWGGSAVSKPKPVVAKKAVVAKKVY